jgi:hypothetical protein
MRRLSAPNSTTSSLNLRPKARTPSPSCRNGSGGIADHDVNEAETKEFQRLCRILDLDPEFVTQASGAGLAQARDLGV